MLKDLGKQGENLSQHGESKRGQGKDRNNSGGELIQKLLVNGDSQGWYIIAGTRLNGYSYVMVTCMWGQKILHQGNHMVGFALLFKW